MQHKISTHFYNARIYITTTRRNGTLPHACGEEGDQQKPHVGPTQWLNNPLNTHVVRWIITYTCNHHNIEQCYHDFFWGDVAWACMIWQHHSSVQRGRICSDNNKVWWNTLPTTVWYLSLEWPDVTYVFLLMKPMVFNCFISETTLLSFIFSLSLPILCVLSLCPVAYPRHPKSLPSCKNPNAMSHGPMAIHTFHVCVCVCWGGGRAGSSEAGPGKDIWIPIVWTAGMKALVPIGAPVSTVGARDVVSAWTSRRASGTP